MDALTLMANSLGGMHKMLDSAVDRMTAEQLNFRASEGGISPFFSLWHFVRTEDLYIHQRFQDLDTIWETGSYAERFGLPATGQGTGMTDEEARAVVIDDVAGWFEYQQQVWQATEAYLETLEPASLEGVEVTLGPPGGPTREITLWKVLVGQFLAHGYRHVGEIEFSRGVQGMGGLTN